MQVIKTIQIEAFEQFLQLPENAERDFELVGGEVIEMPEGTPEHGWIAFKIATLIAFYLMSNPIGEAYGDSHDFTLTPNLVLRPDAFYFSKIRLPGLPDKFESAPDIAIEVVSPSNYRPEIERKVEAYLKYGSTLVWVFCPEEKVVRVHAMQKELRTVRTLTINESLDGGQVLPGFVAPINALFPEHKIRP